MPRHVALITQFFKNRTRTQSRHCRSTKSTLCALASQGFPWQPLANLGGPRCLANSLAVSQGRPVPMAASLPPCWPSYFVIFPTFVRTGRLVWRLAISDPYRDWVHRLDSSSEFAKHGTNECSLTAAWLPDGQACVSPEPWQFLVDVVDRLTFGAALQATQTSNPEHRNRDGYCP